MFAIQMKVNFRLNLGLSPPPSALRSIHNGPYLTEDIFLAFEYLMS